MVVAVTGHSGFIGKHLCTAILKKGWTLIKIGKSFEPIKCDRVYHLACPSSTKQINNNPVGVMDTILDGTRKAMKICANAEFVNASSIGANDTRGNNEQVCYNSAKRVIELYLEYSDINNVNYLLPSVYGDGMNRDSFIKRCVDGNAFEPRDSEKLHYISHISSIIESLIELTPLDIEEITLGDIYEHFSSGRRGLHRSASSP